MTRLDDIQKQKKLDALNRTTVGEHTRGALIGAATAPVLGTISRALSGDMRPKSLGRKMLAEATNGALVGGIVPLLKNRVERKVTATGLNKEGAELTEARRDKLKETTFAVNTPGKGGKYPIPDASHAANALARVDQHGTPEEKSKVYGAVAKKFPTLAARSSVPTVQAKGEARLEKKAFPAPMGALGKLPKPKNMPFLPKGLAGTKMDPRKRLGDSAKMGLEKSFDQATDGIKYKPLNQVKPTPSPTAAAPSVKTSALKLKMPKKETLQALTEEGLPGLTAALGAGVAAYNDKNPISGAALGAGVGALPLLLKHGAKGETRADKFKRARRSFVAEGMPALAGTAGAGIAAHLGKSPLAGAALGASVGALPGLFFDKEANDFQTSEYSGPLSYGPFKARSAGGMPGSAPPAIKTGGPPPPGEEEGHQLLAKSAMLAFAAVAAHEAKTAAQKDRSKRRLGTALRIGGLLGGSALAGYSVTRLAQELSKKANVSSPKQQFSTSSKTMAAPKVTAPSGPSIAQISKPIGHGTPLPGATKTAEQAKEALLEEVVRLGLKDVPNTPRLLMKHRGVAERAAVGKLVGKAWDSKVTAPLTALAEKGLGHLPAGRATDAVREVAHATARDPVGHGLAHLSPVPGTFVAYEAAKRGLTKAINKVDPVVQVAAG